MKTINWQSVLQDNQRGTFKALIDLGGAYRMTGSFAEAEACFKEAKKLAVVLGDEQAKLEATFFTGNLYYHAGRFSEALGEYVDVDVLHRDYNVQRILRATGDYRGRLEQSSAALSAIPRTEPLNRKITRYCDHLKALLENGLLSESWAMAKRLVRIQKENLDSPHVYIITWLTLAQAYQGLGLISEAEHYSIRGLALAEKEGHVPHQLTAHMILAKCSGTNKRQALRNLRRVEHQLEGYYEDLTPRIRVKLALGGVLLDLGRPGDAMHEVVAAGSLLEQHRRFPELFEHLLLQAECAEGVSQWSEALHCLDQAQQYETQCIRAVRFPLNLPLACARVSVACKDQARRRDSALVAIERYNTSIEGLPKCVRRKFDQRDEVRQLWLLGQTQP